MCQAILLYVMPIGTFSSRKQRTYYFFVHLPSLDEAFREAGEWLGSYCTFYCPDGSSPRFPCLGLGTGSPRAKVRMPIILNTSSGYYRKTQQLRVTMCLVRSRSCAHECGAGVGMLPVGPETQRKGMSSADHRLHI
jgi:hypothetical protein